LRYPGKVAPGRVVKSALTSVDFAPSILQLMGVDNHDVQFDGISFAKEVTFTPPKKLVTNYKRKRYMFEGGPNALWVAVIEKDIRLVVSSMEIPWLFDLEADPFEVINFFDNPKYLDIQTRLLEDLYVFLDEYDIPLKHNSLMAWSIPACYNSNDNFSLKRNQYTCDDIGWSLPSKRCNRKKMKKYCPVTCDSCCEDTIQAKIWFKGEVLQGCNELEPLCPGNKIVQKLCPTTCNTCGSNNGIPIDDDTQQNDDDI
jgi:hypothetical protein